MCYSDIREQNYKTMKIGENSGAGAKLAGRSLSRNQLRTEIIKLILSWEFRSFNFVYGNLFIYFSGQFCSTENRMTVSKTRVPT